MSGTREKQVKRHSSDDAGQSCSANKPTDPCPNLPIRMLADFTNPNNFSEYEGENKNNPKPCFISEKEPAFRTYARVESAIDCEGQNKKKHQITAIQDKYRVLIEQWEPDHAFIDTIFTEGDIICVAINSHKGFKAGARVKQLHGKWESGRDYNYKIVVNNILSVAKMPSATCIPDAFKNKYGDPRTWMHAEDVHDMDISTMPSFF